MKCPDCSKDWGHSYCGTCGGTGVVLGPAIPLLFYGAILERNEDGSRKTIGAAAVLGKPEWFVRMPGGKCYALATAVTVPAIPLEWIEHLERPS